MDDSQLRADLADLRQQINDTRRMVTQMDSALMMGTNLTDENGQERAVTSEEVAALKARLNEMTEQERMLAQQVEGAPVFQTIDYTMTENIIDFAKSWWHVLLACAAAMFFLFSSVIAEKAAAPSEEEAAEIRENFQGQSKDDIDGAIQFMQESFR
jgi:uncharacterized membrane protein